MLIHNCWFFQQAIIMQCDNCNGWFWIKSWGTKRKEQSIPPGGGGTGRSRKADWNLEGSSNQHDQQSVWGETANAKSWVERMRPGLPEQSAPWGEQREQSWTGRMGLDHTHHNRMRNCTGKHFVNCKISINACYYNDFFYSFLPQSPCGAEHDKLPHQCFATFKPELEPGLHILAM